MGSPRPVESELNTCNMGKYLGLFAGAYTEVPSALHVITDLNTSQLADGHLQFFDIDHRMCKSISLRQVRRCLGLTVHHGPNSCSTAMPGPRPASKPTPSHSGRGDR